MSLNDFVTLGRSGLRVSPLSLGTMTFGGTTGWGTDESLSLSIFNRYLELGGNFIDTADGYADGRSEQFVGKFIADRKLRDSVVLATKFTFNAQSGNPNAGGNGRKNIYRALDASLRRLGVDFIDLYWLHAWDRVTPAEEVVATLNHLVRDGKIRHYAFSDVPAWYVARAATLAEKDSQDRPIALQLEYSLVERSIEREHIPAAQELGLGVCPWSPLASGFLSGKYQHEAGGARGEGRLEVLKSSPNPVFNKFTERNWRILDALLDVSNRLARPPAQVALNWVATQSGITSCIIGATKLAQLDDNVAALSFAIPADLRARLDTASALEPIQPYIFFSDFIQARVTGDVRVQAWSPNRTLTQPPAAKVSAAEK
ncbi:MAG: aldo/keto reductase [Candidatus Acidiferrales bacterium]